MKPRTAETLLWVDRLLVLKAAVESRAPAAVPMIRRDLARLGGRIERDRAVAPAGAGPVLRTKVKQLGDLLTVAAKRPPRESEAGPTPEALARPSRRDPIAALRAPRAGRQGEALEPWLNADQERAARQIAGIHAAIAAAGAARIGRMDAAGRPPKGSYRLHELPEELAELHTRRYLPWVRRMQAEDRIGFAIVLAVAVHEREPRALRTVFRMRRETLIRRLANGLDLYYADNRAWMRKSHASKLR